MDKNVKYAHLKIKTGDNAMKYIQLTMSFVFLKSENVL